MPTGELVPPITVHNRAEMKTEMEHESNESGGGLLGSIKSKLGIGQKSEETVTTSVATVTEKREAKAAAVADHKWDKTEEEVFKARQARAVVESKQQEARQLAEKSAAAKQEADDLRQVAAECFKREADLEKRAGESRAVADAKARDLEELKRTMDGKHQQLNKLMKETEEARKEYQQKLAAARDRAEELERRGDDVVDADQDYAAAQERVTAIDRAVDSAATALENDKQTLEDRKKVLDLLEGELSQARLRAAHLEQQLKTARKEALEKTQQVEAQRKLYEDGLRGIKPVAITKERREHMLHDAQVRAQHLAQAVEDLKAKAKAAEDAKNKAAEAAKAALAELDRVAKQEKALENELSEMHTREGRLKEDQRISALRERERRSELEALRVSAPKKAELSRTRETEAEELAIQYKRIHDEAEMAVKLEAEHWDRAKAMGDQAHLERMRRAASGLDAEEFVKTRVLGEGRQVAVVSDTTPAVEGMK